MQDITLSTRGLTKCFGGRPALCSCTLQVQRGAVCCLLGRNGAGKTTLLKLLLGLLRPTAGSASILGWTASGTAPPCCGRPAASSRPPPFTTTCPPPRTCACTSPIWGCRTGPFP